MSDQPLPTGWRWVDLGDLAAETPYAITDGPFGSNLKSDHYTPSGPRVIRLQNIGEGVFVDEQAHISEEHFARLRKHQVTTGDLVVAILGERLPRACRIPPGVEPAIVKADCVKVALHPRLADGRYINWWLNSSGVQRRTTAMLKGVGRPRINLSKLRQIPVAVPPLPEQRRIVAKIEELFSDLDAGVAALGRVRANLKRYRAAVLKAAVEGRLTEAWRKRNPVAPEDAAAKLLERILLGRRAKWEQDQLRKFKEAGKTPPKGWKAKYEEPVSPVVEEAAPLPPSWCWATMEQLTTDGPQNGVYYPKSQYGHGTPIIRIDDYQNYWSRTSDELQRVNAPSDDVVTYGVRAGDIIINRVNSMTHLGKCLLIEPKHVPALFESNMMRQSMASQVLPPFVAHYLKSGVGNARLIANAKWAVNQASINQTDVGNTAVPLPPLAEQSAIVAEVDRRLSVADAAEQQVEHVLQRAVRLRQSILKRAFEGRLVPQDPADQPATKMLERTSAATNGHRAVIETNGTPRRNTPKRRSRARA